MYGQNRFYGNPDKKKENTPIQKASILPKSSEELPRDTISSIHWMHDKPFFGVTSFDGSFRVYEIFCRGNSGNFHMVTMFQYPFPLLDFQFMEEQGMAFIGTAEGKIICVQIQKSNHVNKEFKVFGEHKGPVFKLFYEAKSKRLVSVDTIDSVQVFDVERGQLVSAVKARGTIQDCDYQYPLLILALSDKMVEVLNFENNLK